MWIYWWISRLWAFLMVIVEHVKWRFCLFFSYKLISINLCFFFRNCVDEILCKKESFFFFLSFLWDCIRMMKVRVSFMMNDFQVCECSYSKSTILLLPLSFTVLPWFSIVRGFPSPWAPVEMRILRLVPFFYSTFLEFVSVNKNF